MGVHEIYNFLSSYLTDATYQIWLRLASSSWEDVNARRTSHDEDANLWALKRMNATYMHI